MKTLVLGASQNPARYSFLAVNRLLKYGHEVISIGNREGDISGVKIQVGKPLLEGVDTITLYLKPSNQKQYYDYIIGLEPRRIIFNPGTENDELENLAKTKGIKTEDACTLVMLSTGLY